MAFGFRTKKKNSADVIFINGNIYTGGDDAPFVGAVAVKDEKILAVGDCEDIEELSSSDTVVHDLEGKYVYPGFIDAHSVFLRELFKDRYLELDPVWDLETVLDEVRDKAEDGDDTVFAWGFNYHILDDYDTGEDRRALLDEISTEQTIVLLASDGFTLWLNTAAMNIIEQVKEDEEADQVTVNQALHILLDYDEEDIAGDMSALSLELAEKGFTSIFDSYSLPFFNSVFQHAYFTALGDSDPLRQRFMGSLTINRKIMPQLVSTLLLGDQTKCVELGDMITYDTLKVEIGQDEKLSYFSEEDLAEVLAPSVERGFNVNIDALDKESVIKSYRVLDAFRDKGAKGSTFVIASDFDLPDEVRAELTSYETIIETWATPLVPSTVISHCDTAEEALAQLTTEAAAITGKNGCLGAVEPGCYADFAVFDENLLEKGLGAFRNPSAAMTVIGGEIVYDRENEELAEMYDVMLGQRV